MFGKIIKFAKDAGAKIGFGKDKDEDAKNLKGEMEKHGFKTEGVDVAVEGDKVVLTGKALTQEEREKLVLIAGNVEGVDAVEDNMEIAATRTHTVVSGDTLSKIAKEVYGDAMKYPVIFEANKPMLSHPDKIYPGQVLRIPALDAKA
ncbi:peptidoglycan-binding protein LysM [Hirschia litorea]|uniref:Peptidoglycan-binding protein LysM n=1 Tax=Hirschia litorea TaxID=1199156 RepID=A0ABW2IJI1_9PROT